MAGYFDEAAEPAGRFRRGWEEAGRPARGGYAFGPAAASMVFGMRGDDAARAEWHEISADMRSAVAERFGDDTAYLRTFDGMVALHRGELSEALTATSRDPESFRRWHDGAWRQWYTAVWAETAVLAELPDRRQRLVSARFITEHNPVASAIVGRAEALDGRDTERVLGTAAALDAVGCRYQWARSLVLAGGEARTEGQARLTEMGAAPMAVTT